MQYTVRTTNAACFRKARPWIHDQDCQLFREEIRQHEGADWKLVDLHVGNYGMPETRPQPYGKRP